MSTIGEAWIAIRGETGQLESDMNAVGRTIQDAVGDAGEGSGKSWGSKFTTAAGGALKDATVMFGKVALAAGALATTKLVKFGRDSQEAFMGLVTQTNSLQRIMGGTRESVSKMSAAMRLSGVDVDKADGSIRIFSKNLGNAAQDSEKAAAMAEKLGVEFLDASGNVKPMAEILPGLSDTFAAMPDGAEKTALAIQLFGRSGTDMLPFLNKGSAAIGELTEQAERMGLVVDDVAAGIFAKARASTREYAATVDGLKAAVGQGLTPITTAAGNVFRQFFIPIMERLSKFVADNRDRFIALGEKIQTLADKLRPVGERIGEMLTGKLGQGLEKLIGWIENLVDRLSQGGEGMEGFGSMISSMLPVVGALGGALGPLLSKLPVIGTLFKGISGPGGLVLGLFAGMVAKSKPLQQALGNVVKAVGPIIQNLMPLLTKLLTLAGDVLGKLGDALAPLFDVVAKVLVSLGDAIGKLMPSLTRIVDVIGQSLMKAIDALIPVLDKLIPLIGDFLVSAVEMLAPVLETLVNAFADILDAVMPVVTQLLETLIPVFGKIINAVMPVVTMLLEKLVPVFARIVEAVAPLITQFVDKLMPIFSDVLDAVTPLINTLIDTFLPIFQSIIDAVMPVIDLLLNALGPAFDWLAPIVTGVMGTIWDAIGTVFEKICGAISAVVKVLQGDFSGAWEDMKGVLGIAGDAASELGEEYQGLATNAEDATALMKDAAVKNATVAQQALGNWSKQTGMTTDQIKTYMTDYNVATKKLTTAMQQGQEGYIKTLIESSSTAKEAFEDMGGWAQYAATDTVESADRMGTAYEGMSNSAAQSADEILTAAQRAASGTTSSLDEMDSAARTVFGPGGGIGGMGQMAGTNWDEVNRQFGVGGKNAQQKVSDMSTQIANTAKTQWGGLNATANTAMGNVTGQFTKGTTNTNSVMQSASKVLLGTASAQWGALTGQAKTIWNSVKIAFNGGSVNIQSIVSGMKNGIAGTFSNAGNLLVNAGSSIIGGLTGALQSGFGKVQGVLGKLTSLIPSWKGPADKDKTLLTESGELIIAGLVKGFENSFPDVRRSLGGLTNEIADGIDANVTAGVNVSRLLTGSASGVAAQTSGLAIQVSLAPDSTGRLQAFISDVAEKRITASASHGARMTRMMGV
jgi:phage-related protein